MSALRAWPLLAGAGFASMVSMRICDAMLPALGSTFHAGAADTASVISAFALAYGVLQLAYGPLGDRVGKPRVIAMATLGCSGAALSAAMAPTLGLLVASRALMGAFAAGIIPLTMAWIGDSVPYDERQHVLARLLTWTVLGMMLGAWAGGAAAQTFGWRLAFVALAVLFLVLALALRGIHRGEQIAGNPRATSYAGQVTEVLRSPWARRVLAVVFVEGALVFGALAFIPTALHDRFQLSLAEAGGVVAVFGLGGLIYSRLARLLLRRWGAPLLAGIGAACLSAALLTLAVMGHWVLALPACLLAGLGFYMLHNTLQTCATQLSTTARGTGVSLFASALFLGQSTGVVLAAWTVARSSPSAWFSVGAPLVLALGWFFSSRLRSRFAVSETGT
jgi:predicted MFS family arabinose efflux permease